MNSEIFMKYDKKYAGGNQVINEAMTNLLLFNR